MTSYKLYRSDMYLSQCDAFAAIILARGFTHVQCRIQHVTVRKHEITGKGAIQLMQAEMLALISARQHACMRCCGTHTCCTRILKQEVFNTKYQQN